MKQVLVSVYQVCSNKIPGVIDIYAIAAVAYSDSPVCVFVCMYICVFYRLYSELLKSSCEKPLVQFQPNLAGLILG
jgi:hypothetical protein